ncbi:MAG TPA: hypothetical protein VEE86_03870 [Thermoplasmata archaeon]|nr:hypothetical protein [Thermoplasmata archaeon]
MSQGAPAPGEVDGAELLTQLREAIRRAPVRPRRVEVGVAVSVALGRERGAVSCGGCQNPLEVDGIPAETNVHLREPFRLIADGPAPT